MPHSAKKQSSVPAPGAGAIRRRATADRFARTDDEFGDKPGVECVGPGKEARAHDKVADQVVGQHDVWTTDRVRSGIKRRAEKKRGRYRR